MWIQTQNKQRIINSDQIIDIFIDETGKIIYAETTRDRHSFILGEYQDRVICQRILNELLHNSLTRFQFESMPSDGNVNKWISDNLEVY